MAKLLQSLEDFHLSEEEWKKRLSPQEYEILRNKGTEYPFEGKYLDWKETGTYCCAACGCPLFSSEMKYDSGTGWPSFREVLDERNIKYSLDRDLMMSRIEISCVHCESHIGNLLDDGPEPGKLYYSVNSIALHFEAGQA